jgi:hypothetical protein
MTERVTIADAIGRVLDRAAPLMDSAETVAAATSIRERLEEPLRVAIAGRVKAGKSTLLNALVGERLAPTDAGECTKIVTWYRHGMGYGVSALLLDGTRRALRFERADGRLAIDLGGVDAAAVERLDVTWPSAKLKRFTLIDTPGLEAHDEASADRTKRLFGMEGDQPSSVDAVIYLMRHMHRLDARFLESFTDRSVSTPSPVNAIAVLSRADELGAGRPDALDSARRVADRYRRDARMQALCATVLPIAGLIAETGRTLRETEGGSLRALAGLDDDETRSMLRSVDRFTDPSRSPLDPATRHELLVRLGIFGVRFGIDHARGRDATTDDLARTLVAASGVEHLGDLLDAHFGRRARLLKARSAITNTKATLSRLPHSADTMELLAEVERIEASAHELRDLRLLHLAVSNLAEFDDAERDEVERLVSEGTTEERLGLASPSDGGELRRRVLDRLTAWRESAAFPLATASRREGCELAASIYERLFDDLTRRELDA